MKALDTGNKRVFDFTPYVNPYTFAFLASAAIVGCTVGQIIEGEYTFAPISIAISFVASSVLLIGVAIYGMTVYTAITQKGVRSDARQ